MNIVKSYTKAFQWCIECGQYVFVGNHLHVHTTTSSPPPPVPDNWENYVQGPSSEDMEIINENAVY